MRNGSNLSKFFTQPIIMRREHMRTLAIMIFGLIQSVRGQVYLISGATDQGSPLMLAQVASDGSVKDTSVLVPQWSLGTRWPPPTVAWFSISYDLRKALIHPQDPTEPLMVLDLDLATIVKKCMPQGVSDPLWLAAVPTRGPMLEWRVSDQDETHWSYRGMSLDPAIPCTQSFASVTPNEVKFLSAHGTAGVADVEVNDGVTITMEEDGTVSRFMSPGSIVKFDYIVPPELRVGLHKPDGLIIVNNLQVLVISVWPVRIGAHDSYFLAFRKLDHTWHRIPVQSDYYRRLRGFDNYIAIVEGRLKKSIAVQRGRNSIHLGLKDDPSDESAGRKEWRRKPNAISPDLEIKFSQSAAVYPGRLHLFDVNTEKLYTIATNQADSEILLVENQTVYYRVSDRLYSAPVTEEGIGTARLLATGDLIQDAHWAFIKH